MKCQRAGCTHDAVSVGTVYMVEPLTKELKEKEVYACKKHSQSPGYFEKAKIVK